MPNSSMPDNRLQALIEKYVTNTSSRQELDELLTLVREGTDEENLSEAMKTFWEKAKQNNTSDETADWDAKFYNMIEEARQSAPVVPLKEYKKSLWPLRRIAAAAILILLGTGSYFLFFNNPGKEVAKIETQQQRYKNDVAPPQSNKATLTLDDGTVVALDNLQNGTLTTQSNANIQKVNDNRIAYNSTGNTTHEVKYNTLTVPKGSKPVQLFLADGTELWLDAATTITYPTAFVGRERRVNVATGQAYFEVSHNEIMPFIVQKGDLSVQVLGTHFNVNAYSDEATMKITLLEGSVQVTKGSNKQMISPGQQAQVNSNGEIKIAKNIDVDEVMAWKNGLFKFKDETIEPIMRQIERWYDVSVVFEGKVTEHFITTIPRNVPVSQVFKYLETTGRVHFKIEGRKVTVMP